MQPIDPEERDRRLGNVAAILIDIARQHRAAQAAESGADDTENGGDDD